MAVNQSWLPQVACTVAGTERLNLARARGGHVGRCGLVLLMLSLQGGCVSVRVESLTHETYPPREQQGLIPWLDAEPAVPHVRLAEIIATSSSASEDRMRDKILSSAREIGADAVVKGKTDVLETMGPGPLYESTLSPAGADYSPFWGGWWSPFYLDPWSFVQGGADQKQWTIYVSGMAIRYRIVEGEGPPH